jgi:HSP20 family protein
MRFCESDVLSIRRASRAMLSSTYNLEGLVMAVTRYEPWGVISQLQQDINRVFGNLNDGESSSATAQWTPAVDVREYSDRFQLLLDVPGVEPKDVEITLDNGVLTVSGARREEKAVETRGSEPAQQQRIERPLGRFHRRFILPDTVDAENVNASGRLGVLEIVIPKQPKAQPRRIEVK